MTYPVVIAVAQSFKGSLGAAEVARVYREAIRGAGALPRVLMASDGGDGLLEALGGQLVRRTVHRVTGPLGTVAEAPIGWLDDTTAVIESRFACGLGLVPAARRDPSRATTRGVGELIVDAARTAGDGATVYVGLGGSGTMDGGVGMARAWGVVPRDASGEALPEGGGALTRLARLDRGDPPAVRLIGLADVTNPLLGEQGARVYAAQKGASADVEAALARGLERLVAVAGGAAGEVAARSGAGAAGGLGFGIMCFGGGDVMPGAAWVLERVGWADASRGAALALVGEGHFDATSRTGKLTGEVMGRARAAGIPLALVTPRADAVPPDVTVESGGGRWDAAALGDAVRRAVRRGLRLPPV